MPLKTFNVWSRQGNRLSIKLEATDCNQIGNTVEFLADGKVIAELTCSKDIIRITYDPDARVPEDVSPGEDGIGWEFKRRLDPDL